MKEMNKILYIVFNAKKVPQYVYIDQPPVRGSRSGKNQITASIDTFEEDLSHIAPLYLGHKLWVRDSRFKSRLGSEPDS